MTYAAVLTPSTDPDCAAWIYGQASRTEACAAACSAYGKTPREAAVRRQVAARIDENPIWWNVTLPDGVTGFSSLKYLRRAGQARGGTRALPTAV
jgi:hypothetical protein